MVFYVNVSADIYGEKHDIRLEFTSRPSLAELTNTTEERYAIDVRSSRPETHNDKDAPPFRIQTFQVYDHTLSRWVDLESNTQISSDCYTYVFQPDSSTESTVDEQGTIPTAPQGTVSSSATLGHDLNTVRVDIELSAAPPMGLGMKTPATDPLMARTARRASDNLKTRRAEDSPSMQAAKLSSALGLRKLELIHRRREFLMSLERSRILIYKRDHHLSAPV